MTNIENKIPNIQSCCLQQRLPDYYYYIKSNLNYFYNYVGNIGFYYHACFAFTMCNDNNTYIVI